MKTTSGFTIRSLILAAALSVGIGLVSPAFGQTRSYLIGPNGEGVTQLRAFGGDFHASAVNDAGQVVGNDIDDGSSFITGPNGVGATFIGLEIDFSPRSITGHGINEAGRVGGTLFTTNERAFITGPNGVGVTDLRIPLEGLGASASDINNTGRVVGVGQKVSGPPDFAHLFYAFITGPDGAGVTDLGTLGGSHSFARGINDAGQVVGGSNTTGGESHAFITGPDGVNMTDLGTLGGSFSEAAGINDAGQVVGSSTPTGTDFDSRHAFITGPGGVNMTDLGTLGGSFSEAIGINDAGQVVGRSSTAGGEVHAFITGPGGVGMTDLNSLVNLPDGVILTAATGINNLGQVIVLSIPEPESYALMLAGLALVGFIVRNKKQVG